MKLKVKILSTYNIGWPQTWKNLEALKTALLGQKAQKPEKQHF